MNKRLPSTSSTPEIILDNAGDLTVMGWDKGEIVARCPDLEDLSLEQSGETIAIRCQGDCSVRVPVGSNLRVKRASGHATLKSLEGDLAMREVSGHLELLDVGLVTIERVRGHLSARNISGGLVVRTIEGNATVRDVQGDFTVHDAVQGNLTLVNIDGAASVTARGNIEISLDPTPGNSYRFEADGNLHCYIPSDASVKIDIQQANQVRVRIPDLQIPSPIPTPYSLMLGGGDAVMVLSARGSLTISNISPGWGMEDIERAQEKINRSQERLQRKLEAARRRAEMRTRAAERAARDRRKRAEPFGWAPPEAASPAEPVSDAERLMILQMLEQQKITIEEAEQLMAALEGKGL